MNSHFIARADGSFFGMDFTCQCALGVGGVIGAGLKREGDGASPIGIWQTRRLFFRPDRMAPPAPRTIHSTTPLSPCPTRPRRKNSGAPTMFTI
mgnify:CR=1 FL=1